MKLVRYQMKNNKPSYGCIDNEEIWHVLGDPLNNYNIGDRVGRIDEIKLLVPCKPSKIIAIAINFPGIDGYSSKMLEPMVFIKPASSICAHGDIIVNPFSELKAWGEAELGVVVKDIPKNCCINEVESGIFGFTIGNDFTVDNIENRDHHLARSKCPDTFCPLGPWIDTEFDASDCLIEGIQNGKVIRSARSSEQIWKWPQIVSWLSTWMTLKPWDVILTGNPPDTVGMRYIQDSDIYTARIEGLGELTNHYKIRNK